MTTVATLCDSIAEEMRRQGVPMTSEDVGRVISMFVEAAMVGPPMAPEHDAAMLELVDVLDAVRDA